jgi:hypothetical protein
MYEVYSLTPPDRFGKASFLSRKRMLFSFMKQVADGKRVI